MLQLLQRLFGKVFGDRSYVSQKLALQLWQNSGIQLNHQAQTGDEEPLDATER